MLLSLLPAQVVTGVIGRLQSVLNGAGAALKGAGNDLVAARDKATADLTKAQATLETAKTNAAAALKTFEDAKATVRGNSPAEARVCGVVGLRCGVIVECWARAIY